MLDTDNQGVHCGENLLWYATGPHYFASSPEVLYCELRLDDATDFGI